jgi:hypothetical protein
MSSTTNSNNRPHKRFQKETGYEHTEYNHTTLNSWDTPYKPAVNLLALRVPGTGHWTKGDDVSIETTGGAEILYPYAARKTGPHTLKCKQKAQLSTLIGNL